MSNKLMTRAEWLTYLQEAVDKFDWDAATQRVEDFKEFNIANKFTLRYHRTPAGCYQQTYTPEEFERMQAMIDGAFPKCDPHPQAPHGFDRNASHAADRYVCECESWDAYEAGRQQGMVQERALWEMAENEDELGIGLNAEVLQTLEVENNMLRARNERLQRALDGVVPRLEAACGAKTMPPMVAAKFIEENT